jgi:hypothetical protein
LPRRNFGHLKARHCHQERSRKVRPRA